MPTWPIRKTGAKPGISALIAGAALLSMAVATEPMARQDPDFTSKQVRFLGAEVMADSPSGMADAARTFIRGMAAGDPEAVWLFATEEEHAALQTKPAVFKAYALDFPALTRATQATFVRAWQEVDTPFVEMILRDGSGRTYVAELGLWLSDARDWKVVSLDIKPSSSLTAGL